jgi:hypothetical protein
MSQRVVSALSLISILVVTLAFYIHWKVAYSSDTALIGLMAKSILERGERPIFVWSVGYQGILLEAYATALVFKCFGINPYTLNLFNMICLWGLFGTFYFYLRKFFDYKISLLATTLLAVSSFDFYKSAMRTQPNYTETYLFGVLLFWLSDSLIRHFYVELRPVNRRTDLGFAGFGFLAGFATYTYGQSGYFLAAIFLQLLFIYFRDALESWQKGVVPWSKILGSKPVQLGVVFFALQALVSVAMFFLNRIEIPWFGKSIHFNPMARLQASLIFFGFLAATDLWARHTSQFKLLRRSFGLCGISFLVGYFPQIYYKWIQHGVSTNKITVNGTLNEVLHRMSIGFQGTLLQLNIQLESAFGIVLGLAVLAAFLSFSFHYWKRALRFMKFQTERREILSLSPLFFLPWVVGPIFLAASSVSDIGHARYILVLLLFHSLALSWMVARLMNQSGIIKLLGGAFAAVLLINNAGNLKATIQSIDSRPFPGEPAIAELKNRGLKYGYANYWLAYSVDFFTDEDIILEPSTSNYSPHYGPLIRNEKRVGMVDFERRSPELISENGHLKLYGISYKVVDSWKKDGLILSVLEKEDGDVFDTQKL